MFNKKRRHIRNLLLWLNKEVMSAGGDGDAIWISKYHSIEMILPIVERLNEEEWDKWWTVESTETTIILDNHQESWTITTTRSYPIPSWCQCLVVC
jgi:hypothetical protein